MKNARIKLAAGLMVGVVAVLGSGNGAAAAVSPGAIRYECMPAAQLVVASSETTASVRFGDRAYELQRRPSSLGRKYASELATLIIDGSSAVFISEDGLRLNDCVQNGPA